MGSWGHGVVIKIWSDTHTPYQPINLIKKRRSFSQYRPGAASRLWGVAFCFGLPAKISFQKPAATGKILCPHLSIVIGSFPEQGDLFLLLSQFISFNIFTQS